MNNDGSEQIGDVAYRFTHRFCNRSFHTKIHETLIWCVSNNCCFHFFFCCEVNQTIIMYQLLAQSSISRWVDVDNNFPPSVIRDIRKDKGGGSCIGGKHWVCKLEKSVEMLSFLCTNTTTFIVWMIWNHVHAEFLYTFLHNLYFCVQMINFHKLLWCW